MKRDIRISIRHIRRKKKVQRKVQLLQLKFDSTFYVNESKLLSSSSRFKNHKLKGFCHFLASLSYTVLVSYSSRKLNKIKCIIWLSKKLAEIIVKKLSASNSLAHSLTHTQSLSLSFSLSSPSCGRVGKVLDYWIEGLIFEFLYCQSLGSIGGPKMG